MRGWYARPARPYHRTMPATAIVWFRRDLRVHDHPALTAAARAADRVVPVFVLDEALLRGRFESGPRGRFLLGCLRELRAALRERGADLVVRAGGPEAELAALARETGARRAALRLRRLAVRDGARPPRRGRDGRRRRRGRAPSRAVRRRRRQAAHQGRQARTRVFSPFWRALDAARRGARSTARRARSPLPPGVKVGRDPVGRRARAPRRRARPVPARRGGGPRAHARVAARTASRDYADRHDRLEGGTSELSPYLHFGCISAARARGARARRRRGRRAGRVRAPARAGATSTRTCCCTTPATRATPTSAAMDELEWEDDDEALRGVVRGPHRLPGRRRRDAPAARPRLDAQPRAADRRARS